MRGWNRFWSNIWENSTVKNEAKKIGIKYTRNKVPALLHSSRTCITEQPNPHWYTDHTTLTSFSVYVSTKLKNA